MHGSPDELTDQEKLQQIESSTQFQNELMNQLRQRKQDVKRPSNDFENYRNMNAHLFLDSEVGADYGNTPLGGMQEQLQAFENQRLSEAQKD